MFTPDMAWFTSRHFGRADDADDMNAHDDGVMTMPSPMHFSPRATSFVVTSRFPYAAICYRFIDVTTINGKLSPLMLDSGSQARLIVPRHARRHNNIYQRKAAGISSPVAHA